MCRREGDGWACAVTVAGGRGSGQTSHEVTVSADELTRYAPGDSDPDRLVRASFEFLLEREPKESILRRFAISEIERYFPEYVRVITR